MCLLLASRMWGCGGVRIWGTGLKSRKSIQDRRNWWTLASLNYNPRIIYLQQALKICQQATGQKGQTNIAKLDVRTTPMSIMAFIG